MAIGVTPVCFVDSSRQRFGRLVVVERAPNNPGRREANWVCRCDCGKDATVSGMNLRSGTTKSCGCLQKDYAKSGDASRKHGMSVKGSDLRRLYDIWSHMKNRCENPKYPKYRDYGGRGIAVCAEWHDNEVFFSWALSHGYRRDLCIERTDNKGNYEPGNCRWATYKEQGANKRNNVILEMDGIRKPLSSWAEEIGIKYETLYYRAVIQHWDLIDALTIPVMRHS